MLYYGIECGFGCFFAAATALAAAFPCAGARLRKRQQDRGFGLNEDKRMKVVILAGGYGTRISEESHLRPKPMIEIGGKPILWHIMKMYSASGIHEFVICLGYKGYVIKE